MKKHIRRRGSSLNLPENYGMSETQKKKLSESFLGFKRDFRDEFRNIMNERKKYYSYIAICVALVVAFVSFSVVINFKTGKYKDEEAVLYQENTALKEEIRKYNIAYLEKVLEAEVDMTDLNKRINENYGYKLYINQSEVSSSAVYTSQPSVTVELYETIPAELSATFSDKLLTGASLLQNTIFPEKMMKVSYLKSEPTYELIKASNGYRLQAKFTGLEEGDIVTVSLTYSFSQRLGLNGNTVEIIKK